MKLLMIVKKYYEYIHTKVKVLFEQKSYKYKDISVKYLFKEKKNSDVLLVIFSACTRQGVPARYNYVKTLEKIHQNRLYILDDFGEDRRGSYYLGRMPEFLEEKAVIELVNSYVTKLNPKKVIFCGSCKGGYAALNIGSRFEDSEMIIGEPTYRIATEFKLAEGLMKYWMGEVNDENIKYMDYYLTKQLENNPFKESQKIHFFYSTYDEYLERHTTPLLEDLKKNGYVIDEETGDFKAHADLGLYYSGFLKKKVKEIVNE